MEQNKKKHIAYVLFTIGIVLLLGLFYMLCLKPKNEEAVAPEESTPIVLRGMEFYVPQGYKCYPDEESGLIIYSETATLWLDIVEGSYEDVRARKESFIPQAEGMGHIGMVPPEEYRTDKRSYLYYAIDNDGHMQYIFYSAAGPDHHFGIIVDAPNWNTEEVKALVDTVIGSAHETNKEDTPAYNLLLVSPEPVEWEYVSEGSLQDEQGKELVSFQIPEGFYIDEGGTENAYQQFTSYDTDIFVTVSIIQLEWGMNAEDYIRQHALLFADTDSCVKQEQIQGETVYYFSENHARIYEDIQEQFYNFFAVIDLGNGQMYKVEGFSMSNPEALELEIYKEFLIISTKS